MNTLNKNTATPNPLAIPEVHFIGGLMEQVTEKTVYDLVTGKKSEGQVLFSLPAGRAISFPGTNYYVLKLWALYNHTYYLVKNRDDQMRYTVFAKKVEDDAGIRFQNPIGAGWVSSDLTTHLEIKFRFPRQSIFMSLFPASV